MSLLVLVRRVLACGALLALATPVPAQVPSDAFAHARVSSVQVVLAPAPADPQVARNIEGNARRLLALYPGDRFDAVRLEFGLSRVRRVAGITSAEARVDYAADGGVDVIVQASTDTTPRPRTFTQRLRFIDDGERLLKATVSLKGALPISGNQWFDNGATLTQYSPYGRYTGGRGPNTAYDGAPKVGLAGALPLARGRRPLYAYGHVGYLMAGIAGQANGTAGAKYSGGFEEAYAGVFGGGTTASGRIWEYNVSYGLQPYCIGGAMLICQVAGSSGDRAGDFSWPRWSARNMLKAQVRIDNTTVDGFDFEANDFPRSGTKVAGVNVQHDPGVGWQYGATWLTVRQSSASYYLPSGDTLPREGMRALQARVAHAPAPRHAGPIVKAEWARQTHADIDMSAVGAAVEGGWSFGTTRWSPSITYRLTSTTGDDPTTTRYERWDLLYSGGDIDTWVQGQLMKNIQYNSNVRMQRVLGRLSFSPKWRFTASFSDFRANEVNNVGGVIALLAGKDLGRELLTVSEYTLTRNLYVRVTQGALWPGSGVRGTLPNAVAGPWLVGVATLNLQY